MHAALRLQEKYLRKDWALGTDGPWFESISITSWLWDLGRVTSFLSPRFHMGRMGGISVLVRVIHEADTKVTLDVLEAPWKHL